MEIVTPEYVERWIMEEQARERAKEELARLQREEDERRWERENGPHG